MTMGDAKRQDSLERSRQERRSCDRGQITHNGLARLLSAEYVVGLLLSAAGLVFLLGSVYNSLADGVENIATKNAKQDARIEQLTTAQVELLKDMIELRTLASTQKDTTELLRTDQERIKNDITRILNILEARRGDGS